MSDRAGRWIFFCGLLAIASAGTAARLWQINESLWLDELHTSWVISGAYDEIAPRARLGNQSPLYFYVARLSTFALGDSALGDHELALRLPSLLAGIGLIIAAGLVTWRWCGLTSAGWLAATLVTVDHNMIFFSQEARPYALVQFVGLVQFAAFWRLQTGHRGRDRVVVCGGWILLFYLHYTAILLLAGELLWWAVIQFWQRGRGGYRPAHVLCDVAVTVVVCAFSWTHVTEIAARRSLWELFIDQRPPWVALRWFHWDLYVLTAIVIGAGLILLSHGTRRRDDQRQTVDAQPQTAFEPPTWLAVVPLLILWWSVPVMIAWLLTAADLARIFYPRYLIGVAVAPMVCAGLCLGICRGPRTRAAAMLAIIAVALSGNGLLSQWARDGRLITDRRQDWRGAVAWLNATRHDAAPVLVRSGLIEADRLRLDSDRRLREYCLLPVTGLYSLEDPEAIFPLPTLHSGELTREVLQLLEGPRGGWLVINSRPAAHQAMRRELRASLQGGRLRLVREKSFGDVAVWQVAPGI